VTARFSTGERCRDCHGLGKNNSPSSQCNVATTNGTAVHVGATGQPQGNTCDAEIGARSGNCRKILSGSSAHPGRQESNGVVALWPCLPSLDRKKHTRKRGTRYLAVKFPAGQTFCRLHPFLFWVYFLKPPLLGTISSEGTATGRDMEIRQAKRRLLRGPVPEEASTHVCC
jgi:hypothetical protein